VARPHQPTAGCGVTALPLKEIHSSGKVSASADQVWALVGDFHANWHPAIDTMAAEHDDRGGVIRAFTVTGDSAHYRERLTWHSNSERSFAYSHVEGIAGVETYSAHLAVAEINSTECTVSMAAQLTAAEPRATEIATGTQAIFDAAIASIQSSASTLPLVEVNKSGTTESSNNSATLLDLKTLRIPESPALAISYIDSSAAKDTLCLFIHGIGGNRSNWHGQLAALSSYCTTAAMDLRGYGDSALGDAQSTVDDYCEDIIRVADAFGTKKLILCGLSYGAWISTSFAMRHPQRLAALVVSGGCTGMSEATAATREAFLRSREVPLNEGKTPADFAPDVVEILAGPHCTEQVKSQLLESMQAVSSQTYADALRCFTNPTEIFDFALLTMPVLLMTGDADKLAPPEEIKRVASRIHNSSALPDVRFECLHRAGHLCNLEAASAYNTALINLVQRVQQ